MTDMNLTEIICVLDRSGSMGTIVDDAIGGFNTMLRDQQAMTEGRANMTVALFDNIYEVLVENKPVADVAPLDRKTFVPRGGTALFDAVGRTIDSAGHRFAAMSEDERPGKVLFVILTDGQENSSREYRGDDVAKMIEHQTERYGWTFMYLSADASAFKHAADLNIGTRVSFGATGQSVNSTYELISSAARQYRSAGGMTIADSHVTVGDTGDVEVKPI